MSQNIECTDADLVKRLEAKLAAGGIDFADPEYREFVQRGLNALRRNLEHAPIECAEIQRFLQAVESHERACKHIFTRAPLIAQLPESIEKAKAVLDLLGGIDEPSAEIRATAKDVAKLCQALGVNATPFARLIAEPCLVSDQSHWSEVFDSFKALVLKLIADKSGAKPGEESNVTELGQDVRIIYAAKLRSEDRFLSLRKAAEKAGVTNITALYRSPAWKTAVALGAGNPARGSKDKDGNLEAVDDREK